MPTIAHFVIQNLSAKRNLVGNVGAPLGPYSITAGGGAFNLDSLFQSDAIAAQCLTPGAFIPTVALPQRDLLYSARTAGRLSCARNCAAPKRR